MVDKFVSVEEWSTNYDAATKTYYCPRGGRLKRLTGNYRGDRIENFVFVGGPVLLSKDFFYYDYPNLRKVVLPEGMLEIGDSTFRRNNKLEEVVLPSSLVGIGDYAFRDCTSLRSITLPPSVSRLTTLDVAA